MPGPGIRRLPTSPRVGGEPVIAAQAVSAAPWASLFTVYALERPQTDAAALSASGMARGRRRLRGVPDLLQRSADRAGGSGRGDGQLRLLAQRR